MAGKGLKFSHCPRAFVPCSGRIQWLSPDVFPWPGMFGVTCASIFCSSLASAAQPNKFCVVKT